MRLRRAACGAAGWLLTAAGVIAIVVVVNGDYRFSRAAGILVAVCAGLAVLVPSVVGAAYLAVRQRNRATGAMPSPQARTVQTSLASMLDRVNDSTDDALGLRRVVLADRLELTATNLREIDDPWEVLSFIWFVRPSQPADFPRSQQFDGLPVWAQDAVVLLDLRRSVQLRGIAGALADKTGFYSHDARRITQAVTRTGSAELRDAWLTAQRADQHDEHLLELLDDRRVWANVVAAGR
ncbi:hypothetical protein [Aeromicrobium ginsengisoli]|uniref:Uncharacterized protein n=1 Tax=Aeromicrobium ginsengisoli TaxID=363867 RepID=A0A5M4FH94_9ACTN|nr:hypothetical protein [Aeromicrobium ginsengisoli]KAA1399411.1 hypothetical protein ESP70_001150 [Aeromicrobium ginsengisoli]